MFDVGFNELLLIAVIGLLVLGPERLPKVAAQIGRWVARARRTANQLRQELEREIALSEIAKAEKRGQEQGQSSPDDEDGEHETSASDYEADLYSTTHEGLGAAESDARPNGYDGPEHAAAEPTTGEPEAGEPPSRRPDSVGESQPAQPKPKAEADPAAPEHAPPTRAAEQEPPQSTDTTPPR